MSPSSLKFSDDGAPPSDPIFGSFTATGSALYTHEDGSVDEVSVSASLPNLQNVFPDYMSEGGLDSAVTTGSIATTVEPSDTHEESLYPSVSPSSLKFSDDGAPPSDPIFGSFTATGSALYTHEDDSVDDVSVSTSVANHQNVLSEEGLDSAVTTGSIATTGEPSDTHEESLSPSLSLSSMIFSASNAPSAGKYDIDSADIFAFSTANDDQETYADEEKSLSNGSGSSSHATLSVDASSTSRAPGGGSRGNNQNRPTIQARISHRPTPVLVSLRPTQAPVSRRPTQVPVSRRPTQAPVSRRPTQVPVSLRPTQVPVSLRPTHAPTASLPAPSIPPIKAPIDNSLSGLGEDWLLAHNTRREKLHVGENTDYVPLKWSKDLADSAQEYADKLLMYSSQCGIAHGYLGDSYGGGKRFLCTVSVANFEFCG